MATVERGGPNRQTIVTALKWGVPLAGLATLLSIGISNNTCPSSGAIWLRYTIFGLRSGAIYAMIALGYTMVYGVLQLLNFAHSEVFMIGTFAGLYTIKGLFGVTNENHPGGLGGIELVIILLAAILLAGVASGA